MCFVTGPEESGELPVCKEAVEAPLLEAAEQPRGRGVHGVLAGDAAEPPRQLHRRQGDCGQAVRYPEAGPSTRTTSSGRTYPIWRPPVKMAR
jgi:hypothetical protein